MTIPGLLRICSILFLPIDIAEKLWVVGHPQWVIDCSRKQLSLIVNKRGNSAGNLPSLWLLHHYELDGEGPVDNIPSTNYLM